MPTVRRGRPPRVAREHADTREALLHAGMEVLTEQGFVSTGIDTVLKRVNVPKGSFYHYFASKEAFGQAVIQRYADYFARKLDRCLLNESELPLQRLRHFVEEAQQGMLRFGFRRGCLVGNLGQEVRLLPAPFRFQLEAILQDWQRRLGTCLATARQHGDLPPDIDCDAAAAFFWIGWEGAVLRARLVEDVAPMSAFLEGFLAGIRK